MQATARPCDPNHSPRITSLARALLGSALLTGLAFGGDPPEPGHPTLRLVELTGDGLPDLLWQQDDGLGVSVNRGGGRFDPVPQDLPACRFVHALVSDLDGDGSTDLYLVGRGDNLALLGDGTGRFRDGTAALGLSDAGPGASAERRDLDGHGPPDLVLHNATGDVIFWAHGGRFTRDERTPPRPAPAGAIAGAADLLPLLEAWNRDPGLQLLWHLDDSGRPRVEVLGGTTPAAPGVPTHQPTHQPTTPAAATSAAPPTPLGVRDPHVSGPLVAGGLLTPDQAALLELFEIVDLDDGSGTQLKTVRLSGANLQIVDGSGSTDGPVSGLGNLVVGYNEPRPGVNARTGSHNIIAGMEHDHTGFGGFVAGRHNTLSGDTAAILGGSLNEAAGTSSTVIGGRHALAAGDFEVAQGHSFLSDVVFWTDWTPDGNGQIVDEISGLPKTATTFTNDPVSPELGSYWNDTNDSLIRWENGELPTVALDPQRGFTLASWFLLAQDTTLAQTEVLTIVDDTRGTPQAILSISTNNQSATNQMAAHTSVGPLTTTPYVTLDSQRWMLLAATIDAHGLLTFYVDGQAVGTAQADPPTSTSLTRVQIKNHSGSTMREDATFALNRALTAAEIASLRNGGQGLSYGDL